MIVAAEAGFAVPSLCCPGNGSGILATHRKCASFIEYLRFGAVSAINRVGFCRTLSKGPAQRKHTINANAIDVEILLTRKGFIEHFDVPQGVLDKVRIKDQATAWRL